MYNTGSLTNSKPLTTNSETLRANIYGAGLSMFNAKGLDRYSILLIVIQAMTCNYFCISMRSEHHKFVMFRHDFVSFLWQFLLQNSHCHQFPCSNIITAGLSEIFYWNEILTFSGPSHQ